MFTSKHAEEFANCTQIKCGLAIEVLTVEQIK